MVENDFTTFADADSLLEWLEENPRAKDKLLAVVEDYIVYHPFNSLLRRNAEMALDPKKADKVVTVPMSLAEWLLKPIGQRAFGPTKEDVKKAEGWLNAFLKGWEKMSLEDRTPAMLKIASHLQQIAKENLPGWEPPTTDGALWEEGNEDGEEPGTIRDGMSAEWFHGFAMAERVERKKRDKAKAEVETKRLAELMGDD